MDILKELKERILDWRDEQYNGLSKRLMKTVKDRSQKKWLNSEEGRAKIGFKEIGKVDIQDIIVEEKLMNESYLNQPCDSLTKEQRNRMKILKVKYIGGCDPYNQEDYKTK